MQLVSGVEQLPSWDKKLSELPLANFNLPSGVNIYDHAQTIITQTWPNVYYNFPQVHTNHKDTDQEDMQYYLGRINNRNATTGNFEINTVDVNEGISYNRNIMQPLPYWLYLLQKGAEADGLTLDGDILNDNLLKRTLVYGDVKYYDKADLPAFDLNVQHEEGSSSYVFNGQQLNQTILSNNRGVEKFINLPASGIYKFSAYHVCVIIRLHYNGILIHDSGVISSTNNNFQFVFQTDQNAATHNVRIEFIWNNSNVGQVVTGLMETIALHSDYGDSSVINKPIIDITRAVPDVTFGDFLKITKNWFNYDWDVVDNKLVMNKIQTKLNEQTYFDLSAFQTKIIPRKFNQGYSFVLSFGDVDFEDYTYQKIYHSRTLVATDNYQTNQKTTEILIDGLPLPNAIKNGVFTADAFENNQSKVYAVLYNGLTNGNNYTQNHIELLLPNIHEIYWRDWFNFRINAQTYTLVFRAFYEQIKDLKPKLKCWAYNKYFVPRKIERKEIKPDLFEINIEMDSVEAP